MCLFVAYMTSNLITSLWLSTMLKQNEFIVKKHRIVYKQLCNVQLIQHCSSVSLRWTSTWKSRLSGAWLGRRRRSGRYRYVGQLIEWSPVDTHTGAFVRTSHTHTKIISSFIICQTSVKHSVTMTTAVEGLLADILPPVLSFGWHQNGCDITA